jgi:plastocyanin
MNKNLTIALILLFITFNAKAQVVISEIMYNPPESGTDSLEFIELYNPDDAAINLLDYAFSEGVEFTFPDTIIEAKGYFLVVGNSAAMMNTLSISAIQWSGGALSNGGESIVLNDANGGVVDAVVFDDGSPWPSEGDGTDGAGASIEFCLDTDDNDMGSNWRVSTASTGVTINDRILYGTPGAANSADCSAPMADHVVIVSSNVFTPADLTIDVGETVLWRNEGGTHNVNGSLESFPDNPEGFGNGDAATAPWEYQFTFTQEGLYNYQCDPHSSLGMTGTITVRSSISFKELSIVEASAVDSNGVLVNLDSLVTVEGIAYGVNLRPGGLQFTLIDDNNNGIAVFNDSNDFGYNPREGDSLSFSGVLRQFNGLGQIFVLGGLVIDSDNDLVSPTVVTNLSEDTESSLIAIENVSLVDPSQWTNNGFSFSVDVTNGTDTFALVVGSEVSELYEGGYPTGTFNVTGLGGQSDMTEPYLSGYQIWPRYTADISPYVPALPSYPFTTIAEASEIDENGNALLNDEKVEIKGITYGINYRPSGLQFTVIDEFNDGIGVFLNTGDLGYEYAEGDEVSIKGTVNQFNGLTQINPDSINFISAGNDLVTPTEVTDLSEDTESQLIKIVSATVLDPSQWAGDGNSFNVDIETTGGATIVLRIDGDTEIADQALPGTTLMITGIGGQFDSSEPYLDGYQILPRYESDIVEVSSVKEALLPASLVNLYPNPASTIINFEKSISVDQIIVFDVLGRRVAKIASSENSLDISAFASGQYYIQFISEKGIVRKEFIKL